MIHSTSTVLTLASAVIRTTLTCAVALLTSTPAHAIPGDLDPSFGSGFGKALFPVTAQYDTAAATKRLRDGKLLIVGSCDTVASTASARYALCAVRLNEDGSLDTTYGTNGRAFAPYPSNTGDTLTTARDVLLDESNRITVAGYCVDNTVSPFSMVCLARLNENGSVDTSFGNSGFASASFPTYFIQPTRLFRIGNGKLLTSAFCSLNTDSSQSAFCSIRFNADGSLDASYGTGGIQVTFLALRSESFDSALLPDGKLLLAGRCRANEINPTPYQFCLLRVLQSGTVDGTFGTGGQALTPVSSNNFPFASPPYLTVHPDGMITLIGSRCEPTAPETKQYCMVRYSANGSLMLTQGVNVFRLPYFTSLSLQRFFLQGATLQADGKYVLFGQCAAADLAQIDFCLVRLHTSGAFDTTFAGVGYLQTSISINNTLGSKDRPVAIEQDAEGRLTVVGTCTGSSGTDENEAQDFCAARYQLGPFNASYCSLDSDGDGNLSVATDGLINLRVMLGLTGERVLQGVTFSSAAKRTDWASLRQYLISQCATTLPP
jgi:uncharacterized delta-60 repeat protein